ncbi:hypothetical protein GPECTOR_80g162 [Gonium pectorale]|uniref:phytol kinase n=1 Tax=Gonium pectorale TaxID=33097 RepID=A0A150G1Q5_GONPE|nr:hypothetical protein GPECTOR_80g162 [Gonium pectorale]|eukprot:KXZ43802.1 hypothetical protein GPECTOR_80g162 [Gonium pectorale]
MRLPFKEFGVEKGSEEWLRASVASGCLAVAGHILFGQADGPGAYTRLSSLLRSHSLQAASRQLAEAANHLAVLEPGQGSAAWISARAAPLVDLICILIVTVMAGKLFGHGGEPQLPASLLELLAALEDSWALEHAGRTLLLLAPRTELNLSHTFRRFVWAVEGLSCLCIRYAVASTAAGSSIAAGDAADAAAASGTGIAGVASRLRLLLSGRCLRHAVLTLGVVGLCAADGGPDYGLPGQLRVGLQRAPIETLDTAVRNALLLLRAQTEVAQLPGGRSGGLAFALRAGAAALQRLPLELQDDCAGHRWVAALAVTSLVTAAGLLPSSPPASPERSMADWEGWWQLAGGACAAAPWLMPSDLKALGQHVAEGLYRACDDDPSALPPAPAPEVAAALRGGALACLERLMRCAGREPGGPHADVLRALVIHHNGFLWHYLAPLLAYGDPHRAAALVATVGKLLRLVVAQGPGVLRPGLHLETNWACVRAVCGLVADAAVAHGPLVRGLAAELEVGAEVDGDKVRSDLLSFTAWEWLPPVAAVTTASASPATGDDGGWAGWLMSEVGVVPLLGHAMELAWDEDSGLLDPFVVVLVTACGAVAALYGGEAVPPPAAGLIPARAPPLLLPPAEARCVVRTCANPACTNLEGDSEADLRLLACRLCRAAEYCGQACQRAHWRAARGHREMCARTFAVPVQGLVGAEGAGGPAG